QGDVLLSFPWASLTRIFQQQSGRYPPTAFPKRGLGPAHCRRDGDIRQFVGRKVEAIELVIGLREPDGTIGTNGDAGSGFVAQHRSVVLGELVGRRIDPPELVTIPLPFGEPEGAIGARRSRGFGA